jgi:hypothetical protein
MNLPPYIDRPNESLLAKCARIKAEIQAAARGRHDNDNDQPRPRYWWERENDPA